MKSEKRKLLEELRRKWTQWVAVPFPSLPPSDSDLREPVSDLLMYDSFMAGCISQVAETGKLEKRLWSILAVDQDLTSRIAATNDPMTHEFVEYITQLNECIQLAMKILHLGQS
jgi:hypothetical protein